MAHKMDLLSHFAAIVASSDDAIVSKTLEGVVTSWNRTAERMFGYTADEMIGQPIQLLAGKDRLNEEEAILTRIRAGQRVRRGQIDRVEQQLERPEWLPAELWAETEHHHAAAAVPGIEKDVLSLDGFLPGYPAARASTFRPAATACMAT